ncbi:hypothetical protein ES288_A12G072600v1 [Gossypium darwinii]|uniref:Uncharacterized protein n=1 Tax=Gossypium darwinii TaxID=34276 RepID=A0A5D2E6Y6_GOSDA|nr:hypothetical protein ES288_A12G072600v1 [Gossypium darwinii]
MAAGAHFPGEERYVREYIIDVAWWSNAWCGGSARRAVPGDCPRLWRLMVLAARLFVFVFIIFLGCWGLLGVWVIGLGL